VADEAASLRVDATSEDIGPDPTGESAVQIIAARERFERSHPTE
jgi:hypothetical protein